jgi:hypothetical protein
VTQDDLPLAGEAGGLNPKQHFKALRVVALKGIEADALGDENLDLISRLSNQP